MMTINSHYYVPSSGHIFSIKEVSVSIAAGFFSTIKILHFRFVFFDALMADRTMGPRPAPTTINTI